MSEQTDTPARAYIGIRGVNLHKADLRDVEYVRRDPAVIAALPETQAMVADALERAAAKCDEHARHEVGREAAMLKAHADYIRALIPADHAAALAARDERMRAEGIERAAKYMQRYSHPHMTVAEIAAAIRAKMGGEA